MKLLKKLSIILVVSMVLSMLFATCAFAGVYTKDSVTIELGDTVTIAVSSNDCLGHYYVNGASGSCSAWDGGDGWLEPGENGYVSIKGNSLGSGTVRIGYYVTDQNYNEFEDEMTVSVNVIEGSYEGEGQEVEDTKFDVTIDEKIFTIVADLSNTTLPTGFSLADGNYGTEKVNVAKYISKEKEEIILYALVSKDGGDPIFMTFNEAKAEFKEPRAIKQGDYTYFLLSIPSDINLPEDYEIKETPVGNFSVNAIVKKENKSEFVYLYAVANGEEEFYSYDSREGTLQRFPDLETKLTPKVEVVETKNSVNKTMIIIIGVAALAVLAMGIILIVVLAKRKKEEKDNDIDDYYFADDEVIEEEETNQDKDPDEIDELDVIDLTEESEEFEDDEELAELDLPEESEESTQEPEIDLIDFNKNTD